MTNINRKKTQTKKKRNGERKQRRKGNKQIKGKNIKQSRKKQRLSNKRKVQQALRNTQCAAAIENCSDCEEVRFSVSPASL